MDTVLVRDIMSTDPISIHPDASIQDAANVMREAGVGSVLVKEGSRPIGILTERDLVTKVLANGRDPIRTRVSEVMSSPLLTIRASADVLEAARTMARRGVRRLPVTEHGRLVGLLTERDVIAVSPTLVEITRSTQDGAGEELSASLTPCEGCRSLTDGSRRIDGAAVCDSCYAEMRAR